MTSLKRLLVGPESSSPAVWDANASWWKKTFTGGADREYEVEILPLVSRELASCRVVVDIGCGEGQVARRLFADHGCRVIGIDPSPGQLGNADAEGGAGDRVVYLEGDGERLPFRSASVDGAVCCLVIEHVADGEALMAEAARILAPGGVFLLIVNHPAFQGPGSGFVDDQILAERYWRVGPYLEEQWSVEQVDPEVSLGFRHRPLSGYVNPLCSSGLVLTRLLEPSPKRELLSDSVDPDFEEKVPRLCALRFERPGR